MKNQNKNILEALDYLTINMEIVLRLQAASTQVQEEN